MRLIITNFVIRFNEYQLGVRIRLWRPLTEHPVGFLMIIISVFNPEKMSVDVGK